MKVRVVGIIEAEESLIFDIGIEDYLRCVYNWNSSSGWWPYIIRPELTTFLPIREPDHY